MIFEACALGEGIARDLLRYPARHIGGLYNLVKEIFGHGH